VQLLGRPTLVGRALSFTHELHLFVSFNNQSTVLSSHAVGGHQMYFVGLVVGKASASDFGYDKVFNNANRRRQSIVRKRMFAEFYEQH